MRPDAEFVREPALFRDPDGDDIRRRHATALQAILAGEGVKGRIAEMRRFAKSTAGRMRCKGSREMAAAG